MYSFHYLSEELFFNDCGWTYLHLTLQKGVNACNHVLRNLLWMLAILLRERKRRGRLILIAESATLKLLSVSFGNFGKNPLMLCVCKGQVKLNVGCRSGLEWKRLLRNDWDAKLFKFVDLGMTYFLKNKTTAFIWKICIFKHKIRLVDNILLTLLICP